jgi:uncharacterized protein (DUF433 family)
MAFDRITIDHEKMGGLPCIRDLRIPVSTILDQLAAGREIAEILEDFPDLEPEDILAALEYASAFGGLGKTGQTPGPTHRGKQGSGLTL